MDSGSPKKLSEIKARIGIRMFVLYMIIYFGFVVINVVAPDLMKQSVGKLNFAIVYGFGIIIAALIFAFVYNSICNKCERNMEDDEERRSEINEL